ncbi:2-amino-4-hydroxy-6-hydroxymethyldihydropteridine diphosphokinase [Dokdonella sp.]|uniref:2-amino-4-hydroxy-6- hydroxymethyldihydropteridine diphosphokinase n=1 Tax=Dokdonella sp. TaxID=2291710 RepID=UPI0031BDD31D|nr:2-amino-4-hydroxy-6-hydroxymethyldihydropteridine diphosphokinase [Dokdonella sp.]
MQRPDVRTRTERAWLSLGSNLDPVRHLRAALAELRQRFGEIIVSPAYRFAAVGFEGPEFINLAAGIDSDLDAFALNDWLHALEDRHGRRRDVPRFSSRTLDIDIVLFGDLVLEGPGHLQLPRRDLAQAFVLKPLADIAPEVREPRSGRRLVELRDASPAACARYPRVDLDAPAPGC